MRRFVCLLLALLLIPALWGCDSRPEEPVEPVNFYYLRIQDPNGLVHGTADSVVLGEVREALGLRSDLTALLDLYLLGPETPAVRSPFPEGTGLVGWELDQGVLQISLTSEFTALKDLDLTLACACLTRTCLELVQADSVQILSQDPDSGASVSVTLSPDDLIFTDNSDTNIEKE